MDIYTNVKAILIIFFSYLFYLKVSNWQVATRKKSVTGLIFCTIFSYIIKVLASYNIAEPFKSLIIVLLASVFLKIATKEEDTFINMAASFAASYLLFLITTPFSSIIMVIVFKSEVPDFRTAIIACAFEIVFVIIMIKMNINISLPKNKSISNIGFILSSITLMLYSLSRQYWTKEESILLVFLCAFLCAAGLFYWFKSENTIAFNNRAKEIQTTRLQESLDKIQAEKDFLDEVVDYLEKRLHKEDKRLPAYQEAVEKLIISSTDEKNKLKALRLLGELKDARTELSLEQSKELRKGKELPSTDMMLVDAVFSYMFKRAAQKDIDFDLIINGNVKGITEIITQDQLETLAADLIQNAINATEHSSHKNILVYFWLSRGVYELRVEDSGIPFEIDTFSHLGKRRATTHADTGGSGIGFMTTFETLHSCNASLIITEMPPMPYGHTKSIAVRFDGKARKLVRSYRAGSIMEKCNDGSWIIEDYDEIPSIA